MTPIQNSINLHYFLGSQFQSTTKTTTNNNGLVPTHKTDSPPSSTTITAPKPVKATAPSQDKETNVQTTKNNNTSSIKDTLSLSSEKQISDNAKQPDLPTNSKVDEKSQPVTNAVLMSNSEARSLQSNIKIVTLEGDVVELNFSRTSSIDQVLSTDEHQFAYASASSSSSQLELRIDGNLNKNERKSITKLVKKIEEIVNKIHSQETQDALEKISKLNKHTKSINAFSFDYQYSYTQKSALLAYRNIENDIPASTVPVASSNSLPTTDGVDKNPISTGTALADDIHSALDDVDKTLTTENPMATLVNLVNEMGKVLPTRPLLSDGKFKDFSQFLKELFRNNEENNKQKHDERLSEIGELSDVIGNR